MKWAGRQVVVMGLGRHGGGVGVVRHLVRHGCQVTVTDRAPAAALRKSLDALAGLHRVSLALGEHRDEDCAGAELVVVNPAVRPDDPWLTRSTARGVPITTEIELAIEACPGRLAAVTGTNGKSTTVAMLGAALATSGQRVWLGGNFGGSVLDDATKIGSADWVVFELSSFQLHRLARGARPFELAIVTNCTPNHLDWHPNFEHYVAAKRGLLQRISDAGVAVLNPADAVSWSWRDDLPGGVLVPWSEDRLPPLTAPGAHNRLNAAMAAAAAEAVGCATAEVTAALTRFEGLTHRLQYVGEVAGRRFYNDSKATTPEATAAAVTALASQAAVWVLAGGADKAAGLAPAATAIAQHARGAAIFGTTRKVLALELEKRGFRMFQSAETLATALAWCWEQSRAGDAILLSPACASFDQFRDFAHRGDVFRSLVARLEAGGCAGAIGDEAASRADATPY